MRTFGTLLWTVRTCPKSHHFQHHYDDQPHCRYTQGKYTFLGIPSGARFPSSALRVGTCGQREVERFGKPVFSRAIEVKPSHPSLPASCESCTGWSGRCWGCFRSWPFLPIPESTKTKPDYWLVACIGEHS